MDPRDFQFIDSEDECTHEIWYQLVDPEGKYFHDGRTFSQMTPPNAMVVDVNDLIFRRACLFLHKLIDPSQLTMYRNGAAFETRTELPVDAPISLYTCSPEEPLVVRYPTTDLIIWYRKECLRILRADCEKHLGRIIDQFDRFFDFNLDPDCHVSFNHIFNARNGVEGVDWSFKIASEDEAVVIDPSQPARVIAAGAPLTHRPIHTLYTDADWSLMKRVADALHDPNAAVDVFYGDTVSKLHLLSCESFCDL